eukprot:gene25274-38083_t
MTLVVIGLTATVAMRRAGDGERAPGDTCVCRCGTVHRRCARVQARVPAPAACATSVALAAVQAANLLRLLRTRRLPPCHVAAWILSSGAGILLLELVTLGTLEFCICHQLRPSFRQLFVPEGQLGVGEPLGAEAGVHVLRQWGPYWEEATLASSMGGMGMRRAVEHCDAAY